MCKYIYIFKTESWIFFPSYITNAYDLQKLNAGKQYNAHTLKQFSPALSSELSPCKYDGRFSSTIVHLIKKLFYKTVLTIPDVLSHAFITSRES